MSGTGAFPFDPSRIAALSRLADSINDTHAPPPITGGVEIIDDRVVVPVPDHMSPIANDLRRAARIEHTRIGVQLHAGLTLQWSPLAAHGGLVLSLWGGSPDGDQDKDGVACFLTTRGLGLLIKDLVAIQAAARAAIDSHIESAAS